MECDESIQDIIAKIKQYKASLEEIMLLRLCEIIRVYEFFEYTKEE